MSKEIIYKQDAIDAVDSETVSTNPDHFQSSEKFIKFMDDADIASFGKWQWANGFNTALVATRLQLKKLPSAQSEQRWIPVMERLPKIGEKVLVSTKCTVFTQVFKCIYGTPDRWGWEHNTIKKVTAWMPLPEPWKGKQDE